MPITRTLILVAALLPAPILAQGLGRAPEREALRLNAVADPGADYRMALRFFAGEGVDRDNARGLDYLRKAAAGGHAEAQFNLGNYLNMFQADYAGAAHWWRQAGAQDHPAALFNLAELLTAGLVPAQAGESAAAYRQRAVALGFVPEPAVAAEPVPPARDIEPPPASPAVAAAPPLAAAAVPVADPASAAWLAAPADSATIQVFASTSLAEVRAVAARHPWRRPLALLTFERDGQRWHALLHGRFADVAAARRGLAELPPALRAGKPWPRRLGDVRAQTRMTLQALPGKSNELR
ncbi:SPOR domain-containing protein [Azonexus fungiphilus]|uniref:SPOR domain-containing protein n=1 Tax=Azonexus fungiphilus TaxID=146940 RepID=UPI00156BB0BF|nr:SPOR domain-containing protein [Azonexus fungiphilus]NHC07022.1 hypothetical protein [Azonexus fungiphilus]